MVESILDLGILKCKATTRVATCADMFVVCPCNNLKPLSNGNKKPLSQLAGNCKSVSVCARER